MGLLRFFCLFFRLSGSFCVSPRLFCVFSVNRQSQEFYQRLQFHVLPKRADNIGSLHHTHNTTVPHNVVGGKRLEVSSDFFLIEVIISQINSLENVL